jgi:tetratricopeptide (TPR) repeat protein
LFLGLSAFLLDRQPSWLAAAATILLAGYFAFCSVLQNATWRTDETLWTDSVAKGGDPVAHLNLAMSIANRSDPRVLRELDESIRLQPQYFLAHLNRGLLLIHMGKGEAGVRECEYAVSLAPSLAQPHYWLSMAYDRVGRKADAARESVQAADLDTANLTYQYKAALDLQLGKSYERSLRYADRVIAVNEEMEDILLIKGFDLQSLGRLDDSIQVYERLVELRPPHLLGNMNLGFALQSRRRCREAIPHFKTVLAKQPGWIHVRASLADCYAEIGDAAAAARERALAAPAGQPPKAESAGPLPAPGAH